MGNDIVQTIHVELPQTTILTLALAAHEKGVTLNEYVVEIAAKEAKRVAENTNGG
tara:strand:+ start:427 stop:591 length:165 start_codon:yes stop_codon:yes gene_type:complete